MAYLPDALEERGRLIGEALAGSPVYRWGDYSRAEDLHGWQESEEMVGYTRAGDGNARLHLFNVTPVGVRGLTESDPVVLDSKVIDALDAKLYNLAGISRDLEQDYTADFGETESKEDSFKSGLTVALKTAFTFGGEAASFKNETSLEVSTTNEWGKVTIRGNTVDRTVSYHLVCPPGYDMRFWATRAVEKQLVVVTGWGDLEHSIDVGKRSRSSRHGWTWGREKGYWTTFADFLMTVRGEAPSSWNYADWFRANPVRPELMAELEEPARIPFTLRLEFDHVTTTRLRKSILDIRGEG